MSKGISSRGQRREVPPHRHGRDPHKSEEEPCLPSLLRNPPVRALDEEAADTVILILFLPCVIAAPSVNKEKVRLLWSLPAYLHTLSMG